MHASYVVIKSIHLNIYRKATDHSAMIKFVKGSATVILEHRPLPGVHLVYFAVTLLTSVENQLKPEFSFSAAVSEGIYLPFLFQQHSLGHISSEIVLNNHLAISPLVYTW